MAASTPAALRRARARLRAAIKDVHRDIAAWTVDDARGLANEMQRIEFLLHDMVKLAEALAGEEAGRTDNPVTWYLR